MTKSIGPIVYDFKRSFIRLSTLLLLTIFILSGLGLAYLTYIGLSQIVPGINLISIVVDRNNTCFAAGLVYDIKGEFVNNAYLRIDSVEKKNLYSRVVNGYFEFYDNELCRVLRNKTAYYLNVESRVGSVYNIPINSRPLGFGLNATSVYYQIGLKYFREIYDSSPYVNTGSIVSPGYVIQIPRGVYLSDYIQPTRHSVRVIFFGIDFFNKDYRLNAVIKYTFIKINASGLRSPGEGVTVIPGASLGELTFNYTLGTLDENRFINQYIDLSSEHNSLIFKIEIGNSTHYEQYFYGGIRTMLTLEERTISIITSSVGLSLFANFFPIVFLYLAYSLLAKPRSSGALEFVLARPVTKWDIYLTRYLAGVLTATVSTAIFILVMNIAYLTLFGFTLDLYSNVLIYLGLVASLVTFYTLCYMIASSLRSGLYMALSILLYILYGLLWSTIVLLITFSTGTFDYYKYIENSYRLSYFNPLSPSNWALDFVQIHYGIDPVPVGFPINVEKLLDPVLTIATPIIWITICFTIGYFAFRKRIVTS